MKLCFITPKSPFYRKLDERAASAALSSNFRDFIGGKLHLTI
jgi:hypothetical protein